MQIKFGSKNDNIMIEEIHPGHKMSRVTRFRVTQQGGRVREFQVRVTFKVKKKPVVKEVVQEVAKETEVVKEKIATKKTAAKKTAAKKK